MRNVNIFLTFIINLGLLRITFAQIPEIQFTEFQRANSMEDALLHPDSILILDLTPYSNKQKLAEFPEGIYKLVNLRYLILQGNNITAIPDSITMLKQLMYLDLNSNRLTYITPMLSECNLLTHLNISKNPIVKLPESISEVSSLESFWCDQCELSNLPNNLNELSSLSTLSLSSNNFGKFPEQVFSILSLTCVYLDDNAIDSIPYGVIILPNLTRLSLSNNNIKYLPDKIENSNIHNLNLAHNTIDLDVIKLSRISSLEILDISFNQIHNFPFEFISSPNLKFIDLRGNNLGEMQRVISNFSTNGIYIKY